MSKVPAVLKRPSPPSTLPPDAPPTSPVPPSTPKSPNPGVAIRPEAPQTPNNAPGGPSRFVIRRPPSGTVGPNGPPVPTTGALVDKTQVRLGLSIVPLTLKASLAHLSAICPENLDSLTSVARTSAKSAQDAADDALLAAVDFSKGTAAASRPVTPAHNPTGTISTALKRPSTARQRQQEQQQRESLNTVNSGGLAAQLAASASAITRLTDFASTQLGKERALFVPTSIAALTLSAGTLTRERFPIVAYMRSLAVARACTEGLTYSNISAVAIGAAEGANATAVAAALDQHWRMPGALLLDVAALPHAELVSITAYCRTRGIRTLGYTGNPYAHDGPSAPWAQLDVVCVDMRRDLATECGCILAGDADVIEDVTRRLRYTGARLPPRVLAPYAIQCHAALAHAAKHTSAWVAKAREVHTQTSLLSLHFPAAFRLLPCRGTSVAVYVRASPLQLVAARDAVAKSGGPLVFERIVACSDPALEVATRADTPLSPLPFEDEEADTAHMHVYASPADGSKALESVFVWCIGIHNDKYPAQTFAAGLRALLEALPAAVKAHPYEDAASAQARNDPDEWPEVELGTETTPLALEEVPASPAPPATDRPDRLKNFRFK